jgi:hypothetical protein
MLVYASLVLDRIPPGRVAAIVYWWTASSRSTVRTSCGGGGGVAHDCEQGVEVLSEDSFDVVEDDRVVPDEAVVDAVSGELVE